MKKQIASFINKLPYINRLHSEVIQLRKEIKHFKKNTCYPGGHYYSPIADIEYLRKNENSIWKRIAQPSINGIDLNLSGQVQLIRELESFYQEMPYLNKTASNLRYYFNNGFYEYTDAIILYSFIRHFKPQRIIEVGSGFSSALMLDVRMQHDLKLDLTFIEPYPDRLFSLMNEEDKKKSKVIVKLVQDIPMAEFRMLEKGDILFIDSSHVSKTGSDLNYLLFEIIPNLNVGVLIHFHDIFYPFEYPKEWIFEGRSWNEDYFIKAFLMYNYQFKIQFFSHFLHVVQPDVFKKMPVCYKNTGGSLWIEKL